MKERLLGAAVLVAAAVLIIPALLDGPPRERAGDTRQLALPASESATLRTHVVDLEGGANASPAAVERDTASATPAPATDRPGEPPPLAALPTTRPRDTLVDKAPATAAPVPARAEVEAWAVQVGSFSSETNARRLASLLESSDYPAFVVRNVVDGRVMYRVRVGPEPDRERAEALAERLREDRQQAQLVRHP